MNKFRLIGYNAEGKPSAVKSCRHYGAGFEDADAAMKADPTLTRVEIVQVVARISATDPAPLPRHAPEPQL